MNARRLIGITSLVAAVFAAAGATAAIVLRPVAVPDDLQAAPAVTSAAVTEQAFTDERTVQVRLTVGKAQSITSTATGTITQTFCQAGTTITSGTSLLYVDDAPVIALYTSTPLYRDLAAGDTGSDVRALQEELARLGYDVTSDGYYGWGTREAVRALEEAAGQTKPDGLLTLAEAAWLPQTDIVPDSCEAAVGQAFSGGSPLATISGVLCAVTIPSLPTSLVAGERTITLYGATIAMPADTTTITDAEFLAQVASSQDYAAWLLSADQQNPNAKIALVQPIQVVKVPPAAVFALDGTTGCVQAGDQALPITVVGSGLGASLITLDSDQETPASVNIGTAITETSCTTEEGE
ncbi:MAG: peptidoglycan-binding domain-containing protein [Microbacterium sp.]